MPITASSFGRDPLANFLRASRGDKTPIPLIATHIDVTMRGGLAIVVTERTFRNAEPRSIEATMTFPVPVDATLCTLTARIDGRTLAAVAQARALARTTYENAVEAGKAAVLHEELLKGIHMLSVGHVTTGTEVVVIDTWTCPLAFVDGAPRLRIPTTVGEIYGRSPLAADDDLVTGDVVHEATIAVSCEDGTATVVGAGAANGGRRRVTLDRPIDIMVTDWRRRTLTGVAADGRHVTLEIEPAPKSDATLDVDLLFDRSGSMSELAGAALNPALSKFDVARDGLTTVARHRIRSGDRLRLWQFNDDAECLGRTSGSKCGSLVGRLSEPSGGTEIGRAFDAAIAERATNVVIVTDGKSWAFQPHAIARAGIRVTAVLIGEDALEAGIAHLAAITGGQTVVATGAEAGDAIASAVDAARSPHHAPQPIADPPTRVEVVRRGARLVATWRDNGEAAATGDARLIGATAAMLAIPGMAEDAAAKLAATEGVVCHLTSLVLVDEAGVRHEGLPAPRKVALSAPAGVGGALASHHVAAPAPADNALRALCCEAPDEAPRRRFARLLEQVGGVGQGGASGRKPAAMGVSSPTAAPPRAPSAADQARPPGRPTIDLGDLLGLIDWDGDPDALRRGDLSGLPGDLVIAIRSAAKLPDIVAFARTSGIDPLIAVIALLAQAVSDSNRSAKRLARVLLGRAPASELEAAMHEVGL